MGGNDTCGFRRLVPGGTSGRLFLRRALSACDKTLPDVPTRVVVGVHFLVTDRAPDQWSARPIAVAGFAVTVAGDLRSTVRTVAAGVPGIHAAVTMPTFHAL
jgi:hypothetical protein